MEHLYFDREKAEPSEKREHAIFERRVCEALVFWYVPVQSEKGKWAPVWEKGLKLCYGA